MFILEFYSNMHAIDTFVPQFTTVFKGTRIVVTLDLLSGIQCVPKVDHLNYPSHSCLCNIPCDELASLFCEKAMVWEDTLNFFTTKFAKGPRILNRVMTIVLTPRSHYNTITEPHAHFLLSLQEDLSIDFPSYMIVSMIDIYRDTATGDKLIFPSVITCILTHLHVTIPSSPLFYTMSAISKESIRRSDELVAKRPYVEPTPSLQDEVAFCAAKDVTYTSQPSF